MTAPAKTRNRRTDPESQSYGTGRHILTALILGAALIGGLGGWAATAQLGAAVIGQGSVKVDRDLRPVQYLDGGALTEIAVTPGQQIGEGSVVVRFDTVALETDLAIRRGLLLDLGARAARLRAERDGNDALIVPTALNPNSAEVEAVLWGERLLFDSGRQQLALQERALKLRLEQLTHDQQALLSRRSALEQQSTLADDALARVETLVQRNSAPRNKLDEAIADRARLAGELGEVQARLASNAAQQGEAELEIGRLGSTYRHEAHRQLRDIEPRIAELQTQIAALESRIERAIIRAPVSGTVNEVLVNTIGQVVQPGSTLVTLVPSDADLVIEFRIAPTDIDEMQPGQPARLRFPAFDQRTTPELPALVTWVAPATVTDAATGQTYYPALAAPTEDTTLPNGVRLVPGMPVEVYVPTRERTPADYFLQPLRDSFGRAMRES